MIPIEKLRAVKQLVTHANCPDGVASALIVKDALPDVEVLFVKHGTEQHVKLKPEEGTLFVDFSPYIAKDEQDLERGADYLENWIKAGVICLDHHPTQRDITMKFVEAGLGAYGENDRGECGAWLAYEHVWFPLFASNGEAHANPVNQHVRAIEDFAELAGVRDTWKKNDPRWQRACEQAATLIFWGFDTLLLSDFSEKEQDTRRYVELVDQLGGKLYSQQLKQARTAIEESLSFQTSKGTRVLLFQGVTPTSDAAELMEKDPYLDGRGDRHSPDIVAGFHYRVDWDRNDCKPSNAQLQLQFSTRSHTGYDVGAFAKAHGGGGHKAAAGFTVEQSVELGANPYAVFRLLLEEWERGQRNYPSSEES